MKYPSYFKNWTLSPSWIRISSCMKNTLLMLTTRLLATSRNILGIHTQSRRIIETKNYTSFTNTLKLISLLLTTSLLSGCFSLFPTPSNPPRVYTLTPEKISTYGLPKVDGLLMIELPRAGADLDTEKITVHLTPHKVDTYNEARWIERAPKMLQNILVESFDMTRKITAVGADTANLRSDYLLLTELKEFQCEPYHCKGTTHVHVGINAKLIKMPQRKLIASNNFDQRLDAPDNKMDTLVSRFDLATGNLVHMLIEWALNAIEKGHAA